MSAEDKAKGVMTNGNDAENKADSMPESDNVHYVHMADWGILRHFALILASRIDSLDLLPSPTTRS